jgi:hypothetical protein
MGLIRIELSLINIDIGKSYETILYCDATDAILDLLGNEYSLINMTIWISQSYILEWAHELSKCKLSKLSSKKKIMERPVEYFLSYVDCCLNKK